MDAELAALSITWHEPSNAALVEEEEKRVELTPVPEAIRTSLMTILQPFLMCYANRIYAQWTWNFVSSTLRGIVLS